MSVRSGSGSATRAVPAGNAPLSSIGFVRMRKTLDFGNASTNCFDFEENVGYLASPVIKDPNTGKLGLVSTPVYIVDPCQNGTQPLRTMTLFSSTNGDSAAFGSILGARFQRIDTPTVVNTASPVYDFSNYAFHGTSAANTALVVSGDMKGLNQVLAIVATQSGAGTFTLKVEGSMDNFLTQDVVIDNIAAAGSQTKNYSAGHGDVGANVAVSPLAFRFIKVTAGAAGVGITTTVDVSAK